MSTNSSQKQMIGRVVSQEEWLAARKAHLKNEKALTRLPERRWRSYSRAAAS